MNSYDDIISSVDLLGTELKHGDTVAILVTPYHRIVKLKDPDDPKFDIIEEERGAVLTKDLIDQGFKKGGHTEWFRPFVRELYDEVWRGICIEGYNNITKKWKYADPEDELCYLGRKFESQIAKIHDNGIGIMRGVIYRMRKVKKDEVNLLQLKVEGDNDWMWLDTLNEVVIKDNEGLSDEELIAKFKSIWK